MNRGGWTPISSHQAQEMINQLAAQEEARYERTLRSQWYDDRLVEQFTPSWSPFTVMVVNRADGQWYFLYRGTLTRDELRLLGERCGAASARADLTLWQVCEILDNETLRLLDERKGG